MKRQMNRSIKATRLVVATGLVFAIILASADIPYWIVAKAPGLSEQTKIYIIEGTAVLVPTFILMFVGVSFYYTKKFHRVSSISAFSPGGVATISHIENTNSKNYGSAYTRHFGRLSGNWNAAYTIAIC
ncbi:hypothetical protein L596_002175 [Steinernema carpocapsae]|nr:hypothetical protein L596_002175 [Steinernema carpocapsae]